MKKVDHCARAALVHQEMPQTSDAVWLARGAVKTDHMSPETTVAAIRDYIAAFLDTYLQGRPADRLLQRPAARYPDAQLTLQ